MNLTIPLQDFIDSHLGVSLDSTGNIIPGDNLYPFKPIKLSIAELLYAMCENKHTCYIEFPSPNSIQNDPILWSWKAWILSQERYEKIKAHSHKERINRHLYNDNVETLTKAIIKEFGFDEEKAKVMAYKWTSQKNKSALVILKLEKYKTKEEEL